MTLIVRNRHVASRHKVGTWRTKQPATTAVTGQGKARSMGNLRRFRTRTLRIKHLLDLFCIASQSAPSTLFCRPQVEILTQPLLKRLHIASFWATLPPHFIICTVMSQPFTRRAARFIPIALQLPLPAYHTCYPFRCCLCSAISASFRSRRRSSIFIRRRATSSLIRIPWFGCGVAVRGIIGESVGRGSV